MDTYLGRELDPAIPLILWGRTASEHPQVKKEFAVWYWWKDVGVPFMLQARFPPDTLFLVFEEDWRLFPSTFDPEAGGPGF